jgi:predicted nucleotidyltransferase
MPLRDLSVLHEVERSCLARYLDLLVETLGSGLVEVAVYGSVARGETWPRGMPIRSDLDLLVITDEPVPQATVDALVDATMPLFLESGRQLGPQFKAVGELGSSEFVRRVREDAIVVYSRGRADA